MFVKKGMDLSVISSEKLKSVRRGIGFTQAQVSNILNVSVTTFRKWEEDISEMPLGKFAIYVKYLKLEIKIVRKDGKRY